MTTIIFSKSHDGTYKQMICQGHAGYAEYGEDIVCAAVSALVLNTINSLEELAGEKFTCVTNDEDGFIRCDFDNPLQERSVFLLDSLAFGLENIKRQYGKKYLQVKFEEV